MKSAIVILLVCSLGQTIRANNPVSVEYFNGISDQRQRESIIRQAPAEQQAELRQISLHMNLLQDYGGEEGLKLEREQVSAKIRFKYLTTVFRDYAHLWDRYVNDIIEAKAKTEIGHDQLMKFAQPLQTEQIAERQKFVNVISLAFHLVPCAAATDLDERAKAISLDIRSYTGMDDKRFQLLVTRSKLEGFQKQLEWLLEQAKRLPALDPIQAEQMRDKITDQEVYDMNVGVSTH